ncbi:MAG: PA0069 family radical SAM protein [Pseudomonadota bacterium]
MANVPRFAPDGPRISDRSLRGRGAVSNRSGRFETTHRAVFDDGWGEGEEDAPRLKTEVAIDGSRAVINKVTSPDISFDRSINPYRGCEHGCVYCFARPTHAYLGLSAGLDFETKLTMKPDAPGLLRKALSAKRYKPKPIAIGTNTDPYQPIEKQYRIMRGVLEVLSEFRHPVTIVTKSALIVRDVDILGEMAANGLAKVSLSLTTLDASLSRKLEPRAATPQRRLWAIRQMSAAGIPTGAMLAPMIPAINDHEIEALVRAAAASGATAASYIALRLPLEVRDLFVEWLETHYPDRKDRVMRYVRELHGGKDYDPEWGKRLTGDGVYADLMRRRFQRAAAEHGLRRPNYDDGLRTDLFRRPAEETPQFSFMDRLTGDGE